MAEWGVTLFGFRRKAYQNIIADMESKARNLLGIDIDLSSASPLALILRVIAFGLSLLWAVAERVYYSAFVETATGQSLDYAAKRAGISRRPASPARRMLRFTGDPGTLIPKGFLIGTEDQTIRFATLVDIIIESSGEVEVLAEAVTPGTAGNVPAGRLNRITNPIAGVESVVNIEHGQNVDGLNRETDMELRERYYLSLSTGGASTIDSIRASVLSVPGVRSAKVRHNTTMSVVNGMPPKSVSVVVLGGSDADVAQAIHKTIAAGIEPHGDIEVYVEDVGGELQLIRFSRAQVVDVYASIQLTTSASYPLDGDTQVTDAVIKYIGGVDSRGEMHQGLGLNETVIWSAVIEAVRSVEGVVDVDVQIGLDSGSLSRANIPIGTTEVAETSAEKITIV